MFGTFWSRRRLREIHLPAREEKFDILGAVAFSSSITCLLLGLTLRGLSSSLTQSLLAASILSIVIFLQVERRSDHPVLDLSLFKNRLFTAGNLANLFSGIAFAALPFTITLYYQLVRGYDPATAGVTLVPLELTLILVGPLSGWLSDKYGQRGLSTLGLLTASAGSLLLSGLTPTSPDSQILLWLGVIGLGIGMFRSPNASSVMGSVPANKRGISAGVRATIINTSIVASIPFAVAVMAVGIPYEKLVAIIGENRLTPADLSSFLDGIRNALWGFTALTALSAVFSASRGPRNSNSY